jgi:hypothetical protein
MKLLANATTTRKVIAFLLSAVTLMLFSQLGHATAIATTDQFYDFYQFVTVNLNGGLGVAIALMAFLISVVIAGTTQSGMPLVIGIVVAVGLSFGPALIESLVTSGSMLPVELLVPEIKL